MRDAQHQVCTNFMSQPTRATDFVLPLALVASLLVILVPLPAAVMDVLLAVNIAVAVLVLLTTVFVRSPLEFSVFPTVLLAATLGRLVLNVATTRLILTEAPVRGDQAAGGIIEGFGRFVAGDQIVVGLIIFVIIVLIQFLVVTKGATRMSEVAARFALDGMPGRQMSIDADLNAGAIDQDEAQRRRQELNRHADFYGAMDGASKFVRGDAIAGIVITLINIVGGLFLGIVQSGMSVTEAAQVFTKLTIGDGLVSQVPAFLIALAAGLLITRSTERTNLPSEFVQQLLSRPEPLVVAALFLGLLTFTHLPAVPLLLVGGGLAAVAYWKFQGDGTAGSKADGSVRDDLGGNLGRSSGGGKSDKSDSKRVEDLLTIDPIELEIGVGLLRLADPARGGDLLELVTELRHAVARDFGLVLPRVRIRDNLGLEEYGYRLRVFTNAVAEGTVYPLRMLAVETEATLGGDAIANRLDGIAGEDPVTGNRAWWIDPLAAETAASRGYVIKSATETLVDDLQRVVREHAPELLTRDATRKLLDQVSETSPALIEELVPGKLQLGQVQQVLKRLLVEGVSIRNLPVILEALCDHATATDDSELLTEEVRRRLARSLSAQHRDENGEMLVVTLDADWERRLHDLVTGERVVPSLPFATSVASGKIQTVLAPDERDALCDAVQAATQVFRRQNMQPVLLVASALRSVVRKTVEGEFPHLPVLSYREISPDTRVQSLAVVGQDE